MYSEAKFNVVDVAFFDSPYHVNLTAGIKARTSGKTITRSSWRLSTMSMLPDTIGARGWLETPAQMYADKYVQAGLFLRRALWQCVTEEVRSHSLMC